jgi:hypothetical protein
MKAHFNWGLASYSGTRDDMTFAAYREGHLCIAKRWFSPTPGLAQETLRAIGINLSLVWKNAAAGYKADFKSYAKKFGNQHCLLTEWQPSSYALFIGMMFAWQKSDPTHVDLSAVTISDLVTSDAEVQTIAGAVGGGFLQTVTGYAAYIQEIQP